jgi:hypothetical protein
MLSSGVDAMPSDKEEDEMSPMLSATPVMVCEKDELVNRIAKFEIV